MSDGGKFILCDGVGCQATAAVPVALHSRLTADASGVRTTEGWLYVMGNGQEQHFCPACTRQRLKALSGAFRSVNRAT